MNRNFAGNHATETEMAGAGRHVPTEADPLLTDRDVADMLGCGRSSVWRYAQEGVIRKPMKIGGLTRWKRSWIVAAIEQAESAHQAA